MACGSGDRAGGGPGSRLLEPRLLEPHLLEPHLALLAPDLVFLLEHGWPVETLAAASALALAIDVPASDVLIRHGFGSPDALHRALARHLGLPFLEAPLDLHRLSRAPEALLSGLARLAEPREGASFVLAPDGEAWAELVRRRGRLAPGLAIATPAAFREGVFSARGESLARMAAEDLPRRRPDESYRGGGTTAQFAAGYVVGVATGCGLMTDASLCWAVLTGALGLPLLGLVAIKLAAAADGAPRPPRPIRVPDRDLPVYTVLVPLHREARVLPQLLGALGALDYPAAKLDVKIVTEAGDRETAEALAAFDLPPFVEVVVAPPGEPRTKPRALNVALPLARGRHLVVYDAEDVPDPGQLRLAAAAFRRAPPDVACLQARLVVDNVADSWITRFFAVEYAALFDVLNPALARFDLPVPLGGTSNHLRTDVLRALHGWDAHNVTEDADLGMRLALAGYRVEDLPSDTLEEAPRTLRAWMAQRSRWMKGYIQTTVTHSRRPLRNLGRLGLARLCAATALLFGAFASALVFPLLGAWTLRGLAQGEIFRAHRPADLVSGAIGLTLLLAGGLAMVVPPLVALRRRGLGHLWPYALAMPLYYVLVSAAAWRGLVELVRDPQRWNKTEHGLATTSRRRQAAPGAPEGGGPPATAAAPAPARPPREASRR